MNHKASIGLVQVRRVRFDHGKACKELVKVRRFRLNCGKACWRLDELRRICFESVQLVEGL